jgi:hypothetical protein
MEPFWNRLMTTIGETVTRDSHLTRGERPVFRLTATHGEGFRRLCNLGVTGSIPVRSTRLMDTRSACCTGLAALPASLRSPRPTGSGLDGAGGRSRSPGAAHLADGGSPVGANLEHVVCVSDSPDGCAATVHREQIVNLGVGVVEDDPRAVW